MAKAVIYARVSSREQEREGYSIPAQLQLLKEYAYKNNLEIVEEYTDAETAKKSGRTNYNEMLKLLKTHKDIKTILVEKTDRLYRNFKDFVQLEDYDLEVHLVKEGSILSENSKSHEKFIHGIKVLMAKNYIDNLSEEVKKGQKQKAEQGEYPAKPPYGYTRLNNKTIVIDENPAIFVKQAYKLFSEGDISLDKLRYKLVEDGTLYKSEKPMMGKSHLEKILKNIFYTGDFDFSGKRYNGTHEALITKELYYKVQEAFKKDNKPQYQNGHNFAFAGMMTCGVCGCTITAEIKKSKYIYYHCTNGKGICNQKYNIREEDLEKQFSAAVDKIHTTKEQQEWIIEALKQSNVQKDKFQKEKIEQLQIQNKRLTERINKLYVDKLDGIISEDFWFEKHNEWNNQLLNNQEIIKAHTVANKNYMDAGIRIIELAGKARDMYLSRPVNEKAKLLKILLSNSVLTDGKLSWTYKKPFDIFAEGLSCTKTLGRKDSNLRMPGPKPGALPLGYAPLYLRH